MSDPRARARELAHASIARGDATGWFEQLYRESQSEGFSISWVDLAPNPYLVEWLAGHSLRPRGREVRSREPHGGEAQGGEPRIRALVVGCGYGDDAELLASAGLQVTAFDVAPSAIERCRLRFPDSRVRYEVADVLRPPPGWADAFDFVFEAYTVQVLSGAARAAAARSIGRFVAPGGTLLVVARGRQPDDPPGLMPWPLTRAELGNFVVPGLAMPEIQETLEPGDPPVPRLVATFRMPPQP